MVIQSSIYVSFESQYATSY